MNIKKTAAVFLAAALMLIPAAANYGDISSLSAPATAYAEEADIDDIEIDADEDTEVTAKKQNSDNTEKSSAKKKFSPVKTLLICLAIGLLIAFIVVSSMKAKLKTVHWKSGATDYKKKDSFKLRVNTDTYLSKKLEKTPRSNNSSN